VLRTGPRPIAARFLAISAAATVAIVPTAVAQAAGGFLGGFSHVRTVASTVPRNGDVNPYGVAVVPRSGGRLVRHAVLVSNFNAKSNEQGTGTTIVQITPAGKRSVFASIKAAALPGSCPGGVGLTTALVALRSGWVIVGSLPTSNGKSATAKSGCLIVLNSNGVVVETLTGHHLNGPWDATAVDHGATATLFVTNVLDGTVAHKGRTVHRGTVVRLRLSLTGALPAVTAAQVVASGLPERTDPSALVLGPTGVGLAPGGTLYIADTVRSRILAIPHAATRMTSDGQGRMVRSHSGLVQPLGVAIAPDRHVLVVNGGNGNMLEIAPGGALVATKTLDSSGSPAGAGALFGLAVAPRGRGVYFVDDATNKLRLLH
jgi:sugar lactone lactonase YvrE